MGLHPPQVEKSCSTGIAVRAIAEKNKGSLPDDSKTFAGIDFTYLANNSSFQRSIMEFIKKFVPGFENIDVRGSKKKVSAEFDQNAQNYKNVMVELNEVLKKRNE